MNQLVLIRISPSTTKCFETRSFECFLSFSEITDSRNVTNNYSIPICTYHNEFTLCVVSSFPLSFNNFPEVPMVMSVTITRTPDNPSIPAGSMVSLTCEATVSGGVSPSYTWTTTGSGSSGLLSGKENQAVISGRVRESDAGTYTCQASVTGSSQSTSVMLTVTSMLLSNNISINNIIL